MKNVPMSVTTKYIDEYESAKYNSSHRVHAQ